MTPPSSIIVRLKRDPGHCDYRCARSLIFRSTEPFWHFNDPPKWVSYYRQYSALKPSTGLCAVFMAIDELKPGEIFLTGFDSVLSASALAGHDTRAERQALYDLGIKISEVR